MKSGIFLKAAARNKWILASLASALLVLGVDVSLHVNELRQHETILGVLIPGNSHESMLHLLLAFMFISFSILAYISGKKLESNDRKLINAGKEWESTFDAIPDCVAIIDANYKILRVNNAMAQRLGLDRDRIIGSICYEQMHGTSAPHSSCPHSKLLADDREHTAEIYEERLGGYYEVSVSPLRDHKGCLIGCTHVARNISSQKQAEQTLRSNNAELERQLRFTKTLLKAEPIAVFFKDAKGRYLGCNEEFSKIAGITPEDIVGKTVFDLWSPDLAEVYHRQDEELLKYPGHQVYEFQIKNARGEMLDVIFNKDVFQDENGNTGGIIGTFLDISGRKRAEAKIRNINEELEQRVAQRTGELLTVNATLEREISERVHAEETLRNYTSRLRTLSARLMEARESERRHIAHELHDEIGQSLTSTKLSLDRIRRNAGDPAVVSGLSAVQEELNGLMASVRDLSLNLRPSLLDTLGLLPTLQWHFKRFTLQTGISVDFSHASGIPRMPPDIETVFYRIAQEALTNAARHAAVGSVQVSMAVNDRKVRLTIEDKGAGFDLSEALENGRTMGLSGMRERVDDLGGSFTVRSSRGHGTVLTITLPLLCPLGDAGHQRASDREAQSAKNMENMP